MATTELRWPLVALVCLGVWLHAADALVATTVMPSAIAEIGGLAFVYWTIALYELGSVVAGAMTGLAAMRLGLRNAMVAAALVYVLGCVVSALAPSMAVMLGGRLVQGLGGGAMLALSYVGTSQLFPQHLWPRVLALVSGVWGVSALVGPLVGGALASVGLWRGAFWAFAAQGLVLVALTPFLVGRSTTASPGQSELPSRQIVVLSVGVLAISAAGVQGNVRMTMALAAVGLAALGLVLRLEHGARHRLFPPTPFSLNVAWGPGYLMVLSLATATVSFTVYGPLLMVQLFHVVPFTAGFVVAIESVAWTLAAIVVARADAHSEARLIRGGALLITAGVAGLAIAMPRGPVWALLPWASLQGAGFGVCWAFLLRRIVASVPEGERELASSAMPTLQMIGYAVGAAASGMVANALGLVEGASDDVVRAVAFWVFAAFLPLALLGVFAAWRLTRAGS
ncbi:MAG: MFS transporter [Candidatus Binatia bacterium]